MTGSQLGLILSTFLASAVEFVEAFTIVLAMGVTRGWRSALAGTVAALVVLTGVTIVAGYALIRWFPESLLQLVVGTLLLIFGLQWLRKAILRASGLKALHDEDATYREEVEAAERAGHERVAGLDWFAFVVTFKGVLLEGLEVVFIVITFGLNADDVPIAALGAAAGGVVVLAAGVALHRPLARVPENTIKMAVGLLLSTFGTFWAVEGLGVAQEGSESLEWPGGDLALLAILAVWCAVAWLAVRALGPSPRAAAPDGRRRGDRPVRYVAVFGRFWWDFIVGEDWRIAASVAAVLGVGLALAAWSGLSDAVLTVGVGVALVALVVVSIVLPARARRGVG